MCTSLGGLLESREGENSRNKELPSPLKWSPDIIDLIKPSRGGHCPGLILMVRRHRPWGREVQRRGPSGGREACASVLALLLPAV